MDVLKRITSAFFISLFLLTSWVGTSANALVMDGQDGNCAGHTETLQGALADLQDQTGPHGDGMMSGAADHLCCTLHVCPGLAVMAPQPVARMDRFELILIGYKNALHPLKRVENPDRPPNTSA